jgi:hypothetical protein
MTIIRTADVLTRGDIHRLKVARYQIAAIETRQLEQGDLTTILWERDDGPDAITEADLPF